MKQVTITDIEQFIEPGYNPEYMSWDKGDCSLVGIIRVLLIQEIKKAKLDPYEDRWDRLLETISDVAQY